MDSCRSIRIEDFDSISNYVNPDPGDFSPEIWSSSFRDESLRHYLATHWSFGSFNEQGNCQGVVLLQPYLFWNALTQVLWLENIRADSSDIEDALFQIAYRTAREKHMQALVFSKQARGHEIWKRSGLEIFFELENPLIKTTKWS